MIEKKQCIDCGGVSTHGGPINALHYGSTWMCSWCHAEWEGGPRSWQPPANDDRTYPEGKWPVAFGSEPNVEDKRLALVARGNKPLEAMQ